MANKKAKEENSSKTNNLNDADKDKGKEEEKSTTEDIIFSIVGVAANFFAILLVFLINGFSDSFQVELFIVIVYLLFILAGVRSLGYQPGINLRMYESKNMYVKKIMFTTTFLLTNLFFFLTVYNFIFLMIKAYRSKE